MRALKNAVKIPTRSQGSSNKNCPATIKGEKILYCICGCSGNKLPLRWLKHKKKNRPEDAQQSVSKSCKYDRTLFSTNFA